MSAALRARAFAAWAGSLLLALGLLGGCRRDVLGPLDVSLPEATRAAETEPLDVLVRAASSLDPTARARALALLVRLERAPAGGEWGPRGLYDPDAWVERATLEALAERLSEPETRELLDAWVRVSATDPYVRGHAALVLADAGHTVHAGAMAAAWREAADPYATGPLALAAAVLGDAEASEALAGALRRGEVALEPSFVLDVGRSGLPGLADALRDADEAVEPELRAACAVARVLLGDASGGPALRRALAQGDADARIDVLETVSRVEGPVGTSLLRLAAGGPADARWYAALALAARGEGDRRRFARALASPDRAVREMGVSLVAGAGAPAPGVGLAVLDRAVADDDPGVRIAAVRAAGALRLEGAEATLRRSLGDDLLEVRVEAAGALLALARPAPG